MNIEATPFMHHVSYVALKLKKYVSCFPIQLISNT